MEELLEIDELTTEIILKLKRMKKVLISLSLGEDLTKTNIWSSDIKNYKEAKVQIIKNEIKQEFPHLSLIEQSTKPAAKARKKSSVEEKEKISTHEKTHNLFKEGKTIEEIAEIRKFTEQTIYNHLSKLILEGKVNVTEVLPMERINEIKALVGDNPEQTVSDMKTIVGDDASWEEIRIYKAYLQQSSEKV